ncbi:hypothetical protein ABT270_08760 [Streptomyces sp900105245]|uniref:hypothetical protein n=1 Tax=Streptomyces sp. 900105245 TaxID=3154379 RepID=UPI00331D0264
MARWDASVYDPDAEAAQLTPPVWGTLPTVLDDERAGCPHGYWDTARIRAAGAANTRSG